VDPTNNVVPSNGHVTLAWGRDYGDVSPLRGLILGGAALSRHPWRSVDGYAGHSAAVQLLALISLAALAASTVMRPAER